MGCIISIKDKNTNIQYVIYQEGEYPGEVTRSLQETLSKMQSMDDIIKTSFKIEEPERLNIDQFLTYIEEEQDFNNFNTILNAISDKLGDVDIVIKKDVGNPFITPIVNYGKKVLVVGLNNNQKINFIEIINAIANLYTNFGSINEKLKFVEENFLSGLDETQIKTVKNSLTQVLEQLNEDQKILVQQTSKTLREKYKLLYDTNIIDLVYDQPKPIDSTKLVEGDIIIIDGKQYIYYGSITGLYDGYIYALPCNSNDEKSRKNSTLQRIIIDNNTQVRISNTNVYEISRTSFTYDDTESTQINTNDLIPGVRFKYFDFNNDTQSKDKNTPYIILDRFILDSKEYILIQNQNKELFRISIEDINNAKKISGIPNKITVNTNLSNNVIFYKLQVDNFNTLTDQVKSSIFKNLKIFDIITLKNEDGSTKDYKIDRIITKDIIQISDAEGDNKRIINVKDGNIISIKSKQQYLSRYKSFIIKNNDLSNYFKVFNKIPQVNDVVRLATDDKLYIVIDVNNNQSTVVYYDDDNNIKVKIIDNNKIESVFTEDIKRKERLLIPTSTNPPSNTEIHQQIISTISKELNLPVHYVREESNKNLAWTDQTSITINLAQCNDNGNTILQNFTHELSHIYLAYIRMKTPEVYSFLLQNNDITNTNFVEAEETLVDIIMEAMQNVFSGKNTLKQSTLLKEIQNAFNKLFDIKSNTSIQGFAGTIEQVLKRYRNNGIYKAITDSVKYGMKYEALRNATAMLQEISKININCK